MNLKPYYKRGAFLMKNDSIQTEVEMRLILRGKLERKFTIMIIIIHMRVP